MPSIEERVETLEHLLKKYVLMQNVSPGQHFLTDEDVLTQVSAASRQLWILNLTLSDNTPVAGSITWSDFDLYWLGTHYSIPGGNTADKYIWWNAGDTSLTTGATFTPTFERFLIFTNTSGVADEAWNKIGKSSVQRDNMGFVIGGGVYQPAAIVAADIDLTGVSTTDIVDVAGAGALIALGISYHGGAGGVSPRLDIEWSIDDAGYQALRIYETGAAPIWPTPDSLHVSSSGYQSAIGDPWLTFVVGLPYSTHLQVRVVVGSGTGGAGYTSRVTVLRASQL